MGVLTKVERLSGFVQCASVKNESGVYLRQIFVRKWIHILSTPERVHSDQKKGLLSGEFQSLEQNVGAGYTVVDPFPSSE